MPQEEVPAGIPADGRGRVVYIPAMAGDAPTVAELEAGTPLTYSLTADGFRHDTTENTINDPRYTLAQQIEKAGTIVDTLEVQYLRDSPADETLEQGTQGFVVQRLGIPNATDWAAAQIVTVLPIEAGVQREVPPTANSTLQIVQKLYVTGPVKRRVAVLAGA